MKTGDHIYGLNPVLEALRAGTAELVYVSASRRKGLDGLLREAERSGVRVKVMNDQSFFDSRFPKGHQGVAASVTRGTQGVRGAHINRPDGSGKSDRPQTIDELLAAPLRRGALSLYIVLDQIEDPRNLGAILRTAEAAGAAGMVTQERRSAGLTPEAVKVSAGASEHLPLVKVTNIKNAIRSMKEAGVTVVGAEAAPEAVEVWEADLRLPLALVVGSEGHGLRRTVREACDLLVALPLRGMVSSLNASVAAGAVIFEIIRQNR